MSTSHDSPLPKSKLAVRESLVLTVAKRNGILPPEYFDDKNFGPVIITKKVGSNTAVLVQPQPPTNYYIDSENIVENEEIDAIFSEIQQEEIVQFSDSESMSNNSNIEKLPFQRMNERMDSKKAGLQTPQQRNKPTPAARKTPDPLVHDVMRFSKFKSTPPVTPKPKTNNRNLNTSSKSSIANSSNKSPNTYSKIRNSGKPQTLSLPGNANSNKSRAAAAAGLKSKQLRSNTHTEDSESEEDSVISQEENSVVETEDVVEKNEELLLVERVRSATSYVKTNADVHNKMAAEITESTILNNSAMAAEMGNSGVVNVLNQSAKNNGAASATTSAVVEIMNDDTEKWVENSKKERLQIKSEIPKGLASNLDKIETEGRELIQVADHELEKVGNKTYKTVSELKNKVDGLDQKLIQSTKSKCCCCWPCSSCCSKIKWNSCGLFGKCSRNQVQV